MNDVLNQKLAFFYGRSDHKLNAKGQVAVPARFRAMISDQDQQQGLVLIKGEAECVYCYTHSQFREIVDRVMTEDETRNDADFLRDFFEEVYSVDFDSQGRFVLPAELRNQAGICSKDVVFIGHNDRIEIWDAERRKKDRGDTQVDFGEKRSRLARRVFGP
ncbi:MAG: division/cell wall cluster transcriptional repressor MraZ [Planctomycetota bacterium]|jgi:MraZ protein